MNKVYGLEINENLNSLKSQNVEPVYLFITGGGSAGKSHFIKTIYHTVVKIYRHAPINPENPTVLLAASTCTGVAVINIDGTHSIRNNTGDDVGENPGPTIFDIIDPATTVSTDSSQGNEAIFGVNAGKQCVAMSFTAIITSNCGLTLNNILVIGNNLYSAKRCFVQTNDYLLLTDVPDMVSIFIKVYSLQYGESFPGSLLMTSNIGPYMSLRNSLLEVFSNS